MNLQSTEVKDPAHISLNSLESAPQLLTFSPSPVSCPSATVYVSYCQFPVLLPACPIFLHKTHSALSTHALYTVQILTVSEVTVNVDSNYVYPHYHFTTTLRLSSEFKYTKTTLYYFMKTWY